MKSKTLLLCTALWGTSVLFGMHWLLSYKGTAGEVGQPASSWPKNTRLRLDSTRPSVLVFAHPRCPCTRATLSELERILGQTRLPVAAQVVFYRPKNEPDAWAETDLTRKARALPGVRVLIDPEGEEAERFGAETSGHAVVFSSEGALLFSGGITVSRGHAGENAGSSSVLSALHGLPVSYARSSVFGCRIEE